MNNSLTEVSRLQSRSLQLAELDVTGGFKPLPLSMVVPGDCCLRTVDQVTWTPSTPATREVPGS